MEDKTSDAMFPESRELSHEAATSMHEMLLRDPTTPDSKIAWLIAHEFNRKLDSSTVSRHRKKLGLPSATEAKKRGMGPLSQRERNKLVRLLNEMVVPGILELDRHGPVDQDGVVIVRTKTVGDLRVDVKDGAPYWCWLPDKDWNWLVDRIFGRIEKSGNHDLEDEFLNIQQQMLEYIAHATKHRARAISASGATIERVVKGRRKGEKPAGHLDSNDVIKIAKLATDMTEAVDEFRSRVKSLSGI